MDLRLRTRVAGGNSDVSVVEVAGELDLHSAPQLRAELMRALDVTPPAHLVLDLSGVTFLDSTGVGVLVGALKRAREAGGDLYLCGAQKRVLRVFEITGLIGALPLFATRQAALEAFASPLNHGADDSRAPTSQAQLQPQFQPILETRDE